MSSQENIVTIVGLGLIGGSLSRTIRNKKFASKIIGVDNNPAHVSEALSLGLVDEVLSMADAVSQSSLVVIAIPVDATVKLLPRVLDALPTDGVVTDMGSTKSSIMEAVEFHPKKGRYVPSHPMAGTEYSGPSAALDGLFEGKTGIICRGVSDEDAVQRIEILYSVLDMNILNMDALEHDMHVAYVSHISHISSFVLANTVLEKEKSTKAIFDLASGGFESTVRLAKSSPQMWEPIFMQNKKFILEVMKTYMDNMADFMDAIENDDTDKLIKLMDKANEIKRIIK